VTQYIPRFTEDGQVAGIFVLVQDVTELKRVEAELRHSRDEFATLVDTVPAAIFIASDADCNVVRVNRHCADWFRMPAGRNSLAAAPTNHFRVMDQNGREVPVAELAVQRAARGDPSSGHQLRVVFDNGDSIDLLGNATPLLDSAGKIRGAVAAFVDIGDRKRAEDALLEESRRLETLNSTGAALAAELDLKRLAQMITDAGVEVIGARYGAFLSRLLGEPGESMALYTMSGAPRADFRQLGFPRETGLFRDGTPRQRILRSDDILDDPRHRPHPSERGIPAGHDRIRSYLAVPVVSRCGATIGCLLFGHPQPGRFNKRQEQLMEGIAAHAAIAIDNAHLYREAQREIEQRTRAERHQRLLIAELNHRVKNTLAIVQGVAQQTFRDSAEMEGARSAFEGRLAALSSAHDVLTSRSWDHARFAEIVEGALAPFRERGDGRLQVTGPDIPIEPKTAVSLTMAFHELAINAVQHGSWSKDTGIVVVEWRVTHGRHGPRLHLTWREEGGPPVTLPQRKGFGSRMVERALAGELNGNAKLTFDITGARCEINAPLPAAAQVEAATHPRGEMP